MHKIEFIPCKTNSDLFREKLSQKLPIIKQITILFNFVYYQLNRHKGQSFIFASVPIKSAKINDLL